MASPIIKTRFVLKRSKVWDNEYIKFDCCPNKSVVYKRTKKSTNSVLATF